LLHLLNRFIQSETPTNFSEDSKIKNESIQLQSEKLLLIILNFIPREKENIYLHISIIQEVILKKLLYCIFNKKLKIQVSLLKILNLTVHLTFPKYKEYFSNVDIGRFVQKLNERKNNDNKTATSDTNSNANSMNDFNLSINELTEISNNNNSSKKTKKNDSSESTKIIYDDAMNERMLGILYLFYYYLYIINIINVKKKMIFINMYYQYYFIRYYLFILTYNIRCYIR